MYKFSIKNSFNVNYTLLSRKIIVILQTLFEDYIIKIF